MMIRKNLFESCGFFNESYQTCFEDVVLNAKCIIKGYINYCDSSSVSYHLESQTRKKDTEKSEKEIVDYKELLYPFMINHVKELKNFFYQSK